MNEQLIEKKPSVSVMLISYNEEKYIGQAIDSILKQKTTFSYEILCYDDASTDSSPDIILEYQRKYPEIIVPILQRENQASKGDVNIVTSFIYPKARGKYMAYCDADDYWIDENKLQRQYDFLENNSEYSACMHNFRFYYELDGKQEDANCGKEQKDIEMSDVIPWNSSNIPQIGCSMFRIDAAFPRPELFVLIGGGKDSIRPISDMPLYVYFLIKGKIKYMPDVMSIWRRRIRGTWGNDVPSTNMINFLKDEIRFYRELDDYTEKKYEDLIRQAVGRCRFQISWYADDYKEANKMFRYSQFGFRHRILIVLGTILPELANRLRKGHRERIQRDKSRAEQSR